MSIADGLKQEQTDPIESLAKATFQECCLSWQFRQHNRRSLMSDYPYDVDAEHDERWIQDGIEQAAEEYYYSQMHPVRYFYEVKLCSFKLWLHQKTFKLRERLGLEEPVPF